MESHTESPHRESPEESPLRYLSVVVDAAYDGATVYEVLRGPLGASDGCVRRAKAVSGGLLLDGAPTWAKARVAAGSRLSLAIAGPGLAGSASGLSPDDGPIAVVYADDDVAVVEKPAGLAMYPCPGHPEGTLANRLAGWLAVRGAACGIHAAHRLDIGTSGLVAFALGSFAKERLQAQLHTEGFRREYRAVCVGWPPDDEGTVDAPLGRLSARPNVYGVMSAGKPAFTRYRVLRRVQGSDGEPVALLALRLQTGRTHQIRIHLAHIGHPLVGDAAYGEPSASIGRPALHAASLAFAHPVDGRALAFASELPADMRALLGEPQRYDGGRTGGRGCGA